MKSVNVPQLRRFVGHGLALALVLCAGSAWAQAEPEAKKPEAKPEAEPEGQPQPEPRPQPQAQRPQIYAQPMPYGYQPYMNWRPLEVKKPRKSTSPNISWAPLPFGISLDLQITWPQGSGARRILGKSAPSSAGLSASYDVLKLTDKLMAKVDLGWSLASNGQTSPSSSDSEKFRTHLLSLGVSVRYHILRWLAPYARVSGGLGWDKLTVGGSSGQWQDRQTFAHGSVGGGVFFRTPGVLFRPGSSTLGLALMGSIEGGYYLAPSSKLAITASSDAEIKKPIPFAAVPLGTMDRSAPTMRITIGALF